MKTSVNRETCVSCRLCPQICPAVFEMDDDDIAVVKVEIVPPDSESDCREAAESCPVDAIEIEK